MDGKRKKQRTLNQLRQLKTYGYRAPNGRGNQESARDNMDIIIVMGIGHKVNLIHKDMEMFKFQELMLVKDFLTLVQWEDSKTLCWMNGKNFHIPFHQVDGIIIGLAEMLEDFFLWFKLQVDF